MLATSVETDPDTIFTRTYVSKLRRVGHEIIDVVAAGRAEATWSAGDLPGSLSYACRAAGDANKTDKADALGIAHIVRTDRFREVHIKSEESHRLRLSASAPGEMQFSRLNGWPVHAPADASGPPQWVATPSSWRTLTALRRFRRRSDNLDETGAPIKALANAGRRRQLSLYYLLQFVLI